MILTGKPWNEETWSWFFDAGGDGEPPIIKASGGTGLAGAILSPTPLSPLNPGTLYGPATGVAADIYDKQVQRVANRYLVIEQPIPGRTLGLTSGDDQYLVECWEIFDGVWNQNEWAERDADGFWYLSGRADYTMNIAGRRVTAPTIDDVVTFHPAVGEAAFVGVPHPEKGQTPVAFAMVDGAAKHPGIAEELAHKTATELSGPFRPSAVYVVEAIPRTQTGKIPRRILRGSYLGEPLGNPSTLENGTPSWRRSRGVSETRLTSTRTVLARYGGYRSSLNRRDSVYSPRPTRPSVGCIASALLS